MLMGKKFTASEVNVNFKLGLIGENAFVIDVERVFSPSLSKQMIKMTEIAGSLFPHFDQFCLTLTWSELNCQLKPRSLRLKTPGSAWMDSSEPKGQPPNV